MLNQQDKTHALTILEKLESFVEANADDIVIDPPLDGADADARVWTEVVAVKRAKAKGQPYSLHLPKETAAEVLSAEELEFLGDNGFIQAIDGRTKLNGSRLPTITVELDKLGSEARRAVDASAKVNILEGRLRTAERELRMARQERAADEAMANLIRDIGKSFKGTGRAMDDRLREQRKALMASKKKAGDSFGGWVSLLASDWHWDEVVDPTQIEGLNTYNRTVAHARADRLFANTLDLTLNHMSGTKYEGLVLGLGGDMLSGNIHEELRRSNAAPILDSVLDLARKLEEGIRLFAGEFEDIYIPCVVGNHGRLDRKPQAKDKVRDNYDWLLYQVLKGFCGDLENVYFEVSEAADIEWQIYGTRYRLTHGDQIGSAGGLGGIWPSANKTDMRKRQRNIMAGRKGYDYLLMGHWHKYAIAENKVINGSLKGYDEWVYSMNFDWEAPQQALWLTHPQFGMTIRMPVFCDDTKEAAEQANSITLLGSSKKAA
jgi:hypothetical protein